ELKQNHGKDHAKIANKGETSGKDKPLAILTAQPWQRIARQRITQTFSPKSVISFPTLGEEDGTKGPMIIEAEMGGHCVHRIYVDGGSSSEILYEHCFSKFLAGGIVTLQSSRIIPLECSMVSEPGVSRSSINQVREEKIQVAIHPEYPEQTVAIGSTLTEKGRKELCGLLRRHLDLENVRGFQGLKQSMPQGWLSITGSRLEEEDEKKTAFITSQGIFCYSKMSFGLKNAGATYQRLVDKAFQKQIGQNMEVYVDGLVIKSRTEKKSDQKHRRNVQNTQKINMKLNPKKCAFGKREGTFLGYKVDADGLRVSPDKVEAVLDLSSPKCLKDVQKLNGKLASLNRFLFKSAEKTLPFFKTLKKCTKKSDFQWTPEAEGAFKEMKRSIAELPMLTAPKQKEELIMYLAAAKEAMSAVLMTERNGKQIPVYFVSRTLQGPEINYTPIEKLILALVSARRLLKWRFELGEHDIQYRPRTSVKGQILADFIVECPEDDTPDTSMEDREDLLAPWILFTDGSLCIDEYEALIAGLRIAKKMGVQNLQANVDSKLVANQKADALSKISSTSFAHLSKQVLVEELREKAIDEKEILAIVEEERHTWMTPVYEYLTEGILPEEKNKARTVRPLSRAKKSAGKADPHHIPMAILQMGN
nr:reverse transcriptase domain-containing protein [Tanacetum cinerariifolium]